MNVPLLPVGVKQLCQYFDDTMRILTAFLIFLATAAASASAQAIKADFVHGRDYIFERKEATRAVNDANDKGTIRLVTYVYRPVKNDRREVVLWSHGSTGGMMRSPKEALEAPPQPIIRFFVSRGYTLVAPSRRGRGESSGSYVEECSAYTGECTTVEQVAITARALREALADTNAVIDQVILGKLVPRDARIIAGGISRGGFLSLVLAGERPTRVKAMVNFVGGWHGITDNLAASENEARTKVHVDWLSRAAKRAQAPAIWIYAARDTFYKTGVAQALWRSWQDAGGHGEFVFVDDHPLPNGHLIATNAASWERQLDAFMRPLPAK